MKLSPLAVLLTLSSAASARTPAWEQPSIVPGKFIVEFEDDQPSVSAAQRHSRFFAALDGSGIAASPRMMFDSPLFRGASFNLHNLDQADVALRQIQTLATVKKVHPMRSYPIPSTQGGSVFNVSTAGHAAATKRDSNTNSTDTTDTFSTHVMTGVDKLHAQGYTGKGLKIAIVDTGADYNHPALGGCFGAGCRVAFGADLVGDLYTGINDPVPDGDPMDCVGHGTHVAGIIGARSAVPYFIGVAPEATLGIYRVFGCTGETQDDVLIQAFLQAHADGADVITASIGAASGWSEAPWAVVASRIVDAGVPCTIAAGNDGTSGLFLMSSAAVGKGVTAVASVNNAVIPALYKKLQWSSGNKTLSTANYVPLKPTRIANGTYPIVDLAQGMNANDLCHDNYTVPAITNGAIAVLPYDAYCSHGVILPWKIAAAGGKAALYYTADPSAINFGDGTVGKLDFYGAISTDMRNVWSQQIAAGKAVSVTMTDPDHADYVVENPIDAAAGGYMSFYTSWGPSFEVDVKPQVAAPGGNILSTYPLSKGAYMVESGTSMATPFVAGAIALLKQARPDSNLSPAAINSLLAASAKPVQFNDGVSTYGYLAPVAQQGAGLINVYDAANTRGLLSVSSLSFNDTAHFVRTARFEITNTGTDDITYHLGYTTAGTAYTMPVNGTVPSSNLKGAPLEIVSSSPQLDLGVESVTVKAGASVAVAVTATLTADFVANVDAKRLPVYGGFITLNSTAESLTLPYLGVAGSLADARIINFAYPTRHFNVSAVEAGHAYVLPPPNSSDAVIKQYDFPVPYYGLAMGTRVFSIDVVGAAAGNASGRVFGSFDPYPLYENGRAASHVFWWGQLLDGSYIPAGSYKFVFRALKIFGDAASAADYEVRESVAFSLSYDSGNATAPLGRRGRSFAA